MKSTLTFLKALGRNPYFLTFLNGFLFATLLILKVQATYEDGLFTAIQSGINRELDHDDKADSIVEMAMHTCHNLMYNRASVFSGNSSLDLGPEAGLFRSTAVDLMTASGACGSYSQVLARIINTYHIPVRLGQMKANGIYGAHNIVEANIGNRWIVLDPTYDLFFTRPDHSLAGFDDISRNWSYYSRQVPPGYDLRYHYEDIRYTNWNKIPLLMPALKKTLEFCIGPERTHNLSLRVWFLNTYTAWFYIILVFEIGLLLPLAKQLVNSFLPLAGRSIRPLGFLLSIPQNSVGLGQNKK